LVLYNEIYTILAKVFRNNRDVNYIQYNRFYGIEEIGSGGYSTIYTAKHDINVFPIDRHERVVLKRFKTFDQMPELFISEVYSLRIVKP